MIVRILADQRHQAAKAAAVANKQGPSNQRRRRQPKQRIGAETLKGEFLVEVLK